MKTPETVWAEIKSRSNLAELAKQFEPTPITRAALSAWTKVPFDRVLELERILGIPREDLRPDLYPVNRWRDL